MAYEPGVSEKQRSCMPHGCREERGWELAFGDAGQGKGRLCQGAWCVPGTYMAALVSKPGHRCDRFWGWDRKREREMGVGA